MPNWPTVPGDPLAGFALASIGQAEVQWVRVLPVVGTSLLLYAAGMIWNDCADYEEDCRERPERPLPSGRIDRRRASSVGGRLAAAGVGVAWIAALYAGPRAGVFAVVLLGLVLAYNFGSRRVRLLGVLNMGACRGVSLLLGAAAAQSPGQWPPVVVFAAAGIGLYIVWVSWLAVDETRQEGAGPNIGLLIRLLIVIQAGLCACGGQDGLVVAAIVLLGWPVSSLLGKKFYAS